MDYAELSGGQNKKARAENNSALKAAKAVAVASAVTARSALATRIEQRREWKKNAGPLTAAEFEAFGRAAVQPGYDYHTKIYRTVGGQMYPFRQALRTAIVFDPLKLKVMSRLTAELLVDDLQYFDFPEFTLAFFDNLKAELPKLLEHAQKPFDWGAVPGAAEYDAALERERKRKAAVAAAGAAAAKGTSSSSSAPVEPEESVAASERTKEEIKNWQQDPAEKARRIWEWWVVRVNGEAPAFVYWPVALRLVALVQPSSADVKRLFSQLKLILEQIGVSGLEEGIETRLMVCVNGTGKL